MPVVGMCTGMQASEEPGRFPEAEVTTDSYEPLKNQT